MSQESFQIFAGKMLHQDSKYIPEILRAMITERQAELLVALPGTAAEMAAKLGRDQAEVEADLRDFFRKGLAFKKEKAGVTTYRGPSSTTPPSSGPRPPPPSTTSGGGT